jgi:hypothetical protein
MSYEREGYDSREGFDDYTPTPEDWSEYEAWCDEHDGYPEDFLDDVEADADVLRMAGFGTDEDYGYYPEIGHEDEDWFLDT